MMTDTQKQRNSKQGTLPSNTTRYDYEEVFVSRKTKKTARSRASLQDDLSAEEQYSRLLLTQLCSSSLRVRTVEPRQRREGDRCVY